MDRRRFTFWLGFGLFSLSEKLHVTGLDSLAAAAMRRTEAAGASSPSAPAPSTGPSPATKNWHWFERENLIKGEWVLTGTTTPVNKKTGIRKPENIGFLDDSLVPAEVRNGLKEGIDLVGHRSDRRRGAEQSRACRPQETDHEHADHEHSEPSSISIRSSPPRRSAPATADRPASGSAASTRASSASGSARSKCRKPESAA